MEIISPGYRYRKVNSNPFELVANPYHNQVWCRYCKMDVNKEISTGRYGGIDVYRMRCLRCGKTLFHGIDQHLLKSEKTSVMKDAVKFITKRGDNRT